MTPPTDPPAADELGGLSTAFPIVLVPGRVETRFYTLADGTGELRVRIFPDEIAADSHEPELTDKEAAAGQVYWDAKHGTDDLAAWRRLLLDHSPRRAAWIVHATAPGAPPAPRRSASWTRPVTARALPDRWHVVAFRGGAEIRRAASNAIREPLALTLDPVGAATLPIVGALKIDPALKWTVDFDEAERIGMGVRLPLDATDLTAGFDRLLCLGVKTTLAPDAAAGTLAALVDAHHFSRGVSFIAPGTPTNNTSDASVAPASGEPDTSFRVERGSALSSTDSDGGRWARALGLPSAVADHLQGADRATEARSRAMLAALWPATLGYFLDQIMKPVFDRPALDDAHAHALGHLRPGGALPVFRVGNKPYGLLAVTSLARYRPGSGDSLVERELPPILRELFSVWLTASAQVPRIGTTDDPDAELMGVLTMTASARQVWVRHTLGPELQWNLIDFVAGDWPSWHAKITALGTRALAAVGRPDWAPRAAQLAFVDAVHRIAVPLVASGPPSERDGLGAGEANYITWLRTARLDQLRSEQLPPELVPPLPLLYHLLRRSLLVLQDQMSLDLLAESQLATPADRVEPELLGIGAATSPRQSVWDRLARVVAPVTGTTTIGEYLTLPNNRYGAEVAKLRQSLATLETLPTAELERAFTETLDVTGPRLDAWITSLASRRLEAMRASAASGCYLGAFGWVLDVRPAPAPASTTLSDGRTARLESGGGGFVHTPSSRDAAAAAVLRNGYLSQTQSVVEPYTFDLSSARVRVAREVLAQVRAGASLGEVLGRMLQRELTERALLRYLPALRRLYPLAPDAAAASDGGAVHAPGDTVDGLAVDQAFSAGTIPFGTDPGLEPSPTDLQALSVALGELDGAARAVTDLLTAESVYQLVHGNGAAASAALDAMAQGTRPPDPDIGRRRSSGTRVTHRVGLVLGSPPAPVDPSWGPPTLRARTEPALDGWMGALFGPADRFRALVRWLDRATGQPGEKVVTVADLRLRPLDVVALGRSPDGRAELDARATHAALAEAAATDVVVAEVAPSGPNGSIRSFAEAMVVARAIDALVAGARPLRATDLAPPEEPKGDLTAPVELLARVHAALQALDDGAAGLQAAIDGTTGTAPAGAVGALRQALRIVADFGLSVFPRARTGDDAAELAALVATASSSLAELRRRSAAAQTALTRDIGWNGAQKVASLALGDDLLVLPRFSPTDPIDLARALAATDSVAGAPTGVRTFVARAARVRPALARWRKVQLLASVSAAQAAPLAIAQVPPRDGARWIALPFADPRDRPAAGTVGVVLERWAAPGAQEEWCGLLLDEWPELIPDADAHTAVALHYEKPSAQAPATVLIAVPPVVDTASPPGWQLADLVAIVNETIDLTRIRGVGIESLGTLAQYLPALFLPVNSGNDGLGGDLMTLAVSEPDRGA